LGNWRDRQVTGKEFVAFLVGCFAVAVVGLIWGLDEGGARGGVVVFAAVAALGGILSLGWLFLRRGRR
jgi:uncharacterized membrane protein